MKTSIWILFISLFFFHVTSLFPKGYENQNVMAVVPHQINSIPGNPAQNDDELTDFNIGRRVEKVSVTRKMIEFESTDRLKGSEPKIFPLINEPEIAQPGEGGFEKPTTAKATGRKLNVRFDRAIKATPFIVANESNGSVLFMDLSQNRLSSYVNCITQDARSYIWFGLGHGVMRYDGTECLYFGRESNFPLDMVYEVLVDKKGNLWFGGINGICYFDGNMFIFYGTQEGMNHNDVRAMIMDRHENLWIGTEGGGLSKFDGQTFKHYTVEQGLLDNRVRSILEDTKGKIWIGTREGGISQFDGNKFMNYTKNTGIPRDNIRSLLEDHKGNMWFGHNGMGLTRFDGQYFTHFSTEEIGYDAAGIKCLLLDKDENLWIGTRKSGVLKYQGDYFTSYSSSVSHTRHWITDLWEDKTGNIWSGSYGNGVYKILKKTFHQINLGTETSRDWVQSILYDQHSQLWVATANYGLKMYDGRHAYQYNFGNVSFDALTLYGDQFGNIWIGTKVFGVYKYDGEEFFHYTAEDGLPNEQIRCIMEDQNSRMWFATWGKGITSFDGNNFTTYTQVEGLSDNYVLSLAQDLKGNIWVGTTKGLNEFDGEKFTHHNLEHSFTGLSVFSIILDSQSHLWFGSSSGLSFYDGEKFTNIHESTGIKGYAIMSIIEDDHHNLWLGTSNGIQLVVRDSFDRYDPSKMKIYTFDQSDGLKRMDYEANSVTKDAYGNLYWGSIDGLTKLDVSQFKIPTSTPTVNLNSIEIEQRELDFRRLNDSSYRNQFEYGYSLYQSFDSVVPFENYPFSLNLPHHTNDLTFHFTAIDWQGPQKLRYSYFMDNVDKLWSPFRTENSARYNSLPPGDYTFRVRAIGAAQIISNPFEYHFTIGLPWWSTWWAYGIYLVLLSTLIYFIHLFLINRKINQLEILRLREMDQVKSRFYTNITHEFRTPLTVIQGMTDKIKGHAQIKKVIERNSASLLSLINQIIDLAKLDSGKVKVNMIRGDVITFLKYVLESYHSLARRKKIDLRFSSDIDRLNIDFDPDILLKILTNLIGNAIKFSTEGGIVQVGVSISPKSKKHDVQKSVHQISDETLIIKVEDQGIGIAQDELGHIFDRFFQGNGSFNHQGQGSGIGLAYTKELIQLLKGSIQVESEPKVGSIFTVILPITRNASIEDSLPTPKLNRKIKDPAIAYNKTTISFLQPESRKPLILIVEDNQDVKNYLSLCLPDQNYQKIFAADGGQGIEVAIDTVPDLVISDIMMPGKDGYELCQKLKNDFRTSHIPIILLTAKVDADSRLEGLECGADAYLAKPFSERELLIRINQLIINRKRLQQRYQGIFAENRNASFQEKKDQEDSFILKVQMSVLEHIEEIDFSLPELSQIMGMSTSQLYRKINALTGKSIGNYIRSIRLSRAKELLLSTDKKVSEIAYDVGFKDPAYFSRTFSEEFGISPKNLKKESQVF